MITLLLLVAMLLISGIDYQDYNQYNQWLTDLLQPAVVALGVPLFQQIRAIRKDLGKIVLTVLISVIVAITTTVALALVAGASAEVAASLAPKSVTTPIALLISEQTGGLTPLTAIAVIIAGLVGAVFGVPWLNWLQIRSARAQGVAMGTACHALGTARISEQGVKHGAYSAFALVLSATLSALLCPLLVPLIVNLFR